MDTRKQNRLINSRALLPLAALSSIMLVAAYAEGTGVPGPGIQTIPGSQKAKLIQTKSFTPRSASAGSEKGKSIYNKTHCAACHSIDNEGGYIGPLLDGVGGQRSAEFLYARLANTPESIATYAQLTNQDPNSVTQHIRLSLQDAHSIVDYLLTLPAPTGGFALYPHESAPFASASNSDEKFIPSPKSSDSAEGKRLYEQFGCAQCHQIQNAGGSFGPALDGVGMHGRSYISAYVTDAQIQAVKNDRFFQVVPTIMPKFKATPAEVQKITEYLMTLPDIER